MRHSSAALRNLGVLLLLAILAPACDGGGGGGVTGTAGGAGETGKGFSKGVSVSSSPVTVGPCTLVKDINTAGSGAQISSMCAVGSTVFFDSVDIAHGSELWK